MLFQISLFLITETLHDNKQLECSGKWHNAFVEAQIKLKKLLRLN